MATLSFRVKDPQAFAKLDKDGLEQVFSIKNGADGKKAFDISYVDITKHPPEVFYNEDENLGFEFQLENTISKVLVAKGSSIEVSAAEIYKNGTENDLIDYLNAHMRDVVVQYADGASVMDKIRSPTSRRVFRELKSFSKRVSRRVLPRYAKATARLSTYPYATTTRRRLSSEEKKAETGHTSFLTEQGSLFAREIPSRPETT